MSSHQSQSNIMNQNSSGNKTEREKRKAGQSQNMQHKAAKEVLTGIDQGQTHGRNQSSAAAQSQLNEYPKNSQQQLGSVRNQRLKKHQWASTKLLHEAEYRDEDVVQTDLDDNPLMNAHKRVISLTGGDLSSRQPAKYNSAHYVGTPEEEDSTTTAKKPGCSGRTVEHVTTTTGAKKPQIGSLQSSRMRHLQQNVSSTVESNQVKMHSFISSHENQTIFDENVNKDSIGSQKQNSRDAKTKSKRMKQGISFQAAVLKKAQNKRNNSDQQQIQTQRNQPRDSINLVDHQGEVMTPAILPDHGFQSISSQQLLYDLHSTKNGGISGTNTSNSNGSTVTPIVQNYRYRSEQISKIRQRPSAQEIMNYRSVNSGSSAGDENNSFQQLQKQVQTQPQSNQGRLLFKRQEKNAGFTSQALHQRQNYKAARNQNSNTGSNPTPGMQHQNAYNMADQKSQREAALPNALASPRSETNEHKNIMPAYFNGGTQHHHNLHRNQSSVEQLPNKVTPMSHSSLKHQTRSQRRIIPETMFQNDKHATSAEVSPRPSVINFSHQLGKQHQQRISQKLVDRINQQKTNCGEMQMHIQDELQVQKRGNGDDLNDQMESYDDRGNEEGKRRLQRQRDSKHLMPTRQSIPILSTKHFLESASLKRVPSSLQKTNTSEPVSRAQLQNQFHTDSNITQVNSNAHHHQFYLEPPSSQSYDKHGNNGLSSRSSINHSAAIHQHSSSVLPSQRHRQLLQSVNVIPPPASTEKATFQMKQQVDQENHLSSIRQQHVYNSAVAIPILHQSNVLRASEANNNTSQQQQSVRFSNGGNFRYKNLQQSSRQPSNVQLHQPMSQPESTSSITNGGTNNSKILVNKVQQKNQQFKFQFRRKTQQSTNFKLKSNRQTEQNSMQEAYDGIQSNTQPASTSNQDNSGHLNNHPTFHNVPNKFSNDQSYELTSSNAHVESIGSIKPVETGGGPSMNSVDMKQLRNGGAKSNRNQKVLSSQSPPQINRFNDNSQQQSKKYRLVKNAYVPSSNASDNSESANFTALVSKANSRGRLQSVAIQPSSFSKRLSNTNDEKVITSSQNSGCNISGQTLINHQKPPNTPLKQSMQSMQPSSSNNFSAAEDSTTQKMQTRRSTVYDNMMTKKRHEQKLASSEPRGSTPSRSNKRTQKRANYGPQQQSSGGTTSQDGSGSVDYSAGQPHQSLPSIKSNKNPTFKTAGKGSSRNVNIKSSEHAGGQSNSNSKSPLIRGTKKVTSYQEHQPKHQAESTDCPYIIRQSAQQFINVYKEEKTFDSNQQSLAAYRSDKDGAGSSAHGSAGVVSETNTTIFNGQKSLHSAQNIVTHAGQYTDHQLQSIQPTKGLSKTSSVNQFQIYQNNQLLKKGKEIKVVITNQQSAAEIERLHAQIMEREEAYSSLKTQFEQLRRQVAKKQRNSSHDSVPVRFDLRKGDEAIHSGQAELNEASEAESSEQILQRQNEEQQRTPKLPIPRDLYKQSNPVRSSLNELQLSKQRSNSEAHLQHWTAPLRPINENGSQGNESAQEAKSDHRTQAQHLTSKLRQPTKFSQQALKERIMSFSRKQSAVSAINVTNPPAADLSAGVRVLKKKTSYQMSSHSPIRRERHQSQKRPSLPHDLTHATEGDHEGGHPHHPAKPIIINSAETQTASKAQQNSRTSRIGKNAKAPQKTKQGTGVSQVHSAASLEKGHRGLIKGGQSQNSPSKFINKIQKQQVAPQKSAVGISSISIPQKNPTKSKTHIASKSTAQSASIEAIGALSQTNKLAIQNLKQVINSTGKKLGGKKRTSVNPLGSSSCKAGPATDTSGSATTPYHSQAPADQQPEQKNQDLAVLVEQLSREEEAFSQNNDDQILNVQAQASFGGGGLSPMVSPSPQQPRKHTAMHHKFRCAGVPIEQVQDSQSNQRIDTEPVQEQIVRQESMYKEETPSNEQSQNSSNHPQPQPQAAFIHKQVSMEEAKEFKATGTAFGSAQQKSNQAPMAAERQLLAAPRQQIRQSMEQPSAAAAPLVNCFGIQPEERSLDNSSAIFAQRHSNTSQNSAAFANPQTRGTTVGQQQEQHSCSQLQLSKVATTLSEGQGQQSQTSRCETPIHPNQVVDGIKFMDVQDPTYKSSDVFDQCQESDNGVEAYENNKVEAAPRAGTPMLPMNSTGKEFFAVPQTKNPAFVANAAKGNMMVSAFGDQKSHNEQQQSAVQIQKSSIQILKQLQKRKQSNAAQQMQHQRKAQHPKVVIGHNNPFFLKQKNPIGNSTNGSASGHNQTKSSGGGGCTAMTGELTMLQQSGTPMMATDQSNLQADGPDPVPSFGGGNKSSNSGGEAAATATPAMDSLVACKRQASNVSAHFNAHQSVVSKGANGGGGAHENSIVSHDMFYSPIQAQDGGNASDDASEGKDGKEAEQQDLQAIEILPQCSRNNSNQIRANINNKFDAEIFKRGSDAKNSKQNRVFGSSQEQQRHNNSSSGCFQVSAIEPVAEAKRDDILDDSLLFALQDDNAAQQLASHLYDEVEDENEGNVDIEATDQHFFAQQMALQPEIIFTPHNLSKNDLDQSEKQLMMQNVEERSNFKDLISAASSNKRGSVGDGLLVATQQSNPCNEMANLESRQDFSPGLLKQKLDHQPSKLLAVDAIQSEQQVALTDRKDAKNIKGQSATVDLAPQHLNSKAAGGVAVSASLQGTRNVAAAAIKSGSNMGNSGSKCTLTDMMLVSNANLTYSAESSPEKGDLLSNWTNHNRTTKTVVAQNQVSSSKQKEQ